MEVVFVTRHEKCSLNGTSLRVWSLYERFRETPGVEARMCVVARRDPQSSPSRSSLSRKASAWLGLLASRRPFFSDTSIEWNHLDSEFGVSNADALVVHQASLSHLALDAPAGTHVVSLLDEDKSRFAPARLRAAHVRQIRRFYRELVDRSALVAVLTSAEKAALSRLASSPSEKISVHPLGIEIGRFAPGEVEPVSDRSDVGIFGSATYGRRAQPILEAVTESRRQGLSWDWRVCGDAAPAWKEHLEGLDVRVTGRVPDLRPYYEATNAVLVPVAEVPGMKTTLLEALAMRRPVVAHVNAIVGTSIVSGEQALVASDVRQAVSMLSQILADPALANELAGSGSEYVRRSHDIQLTSEELARDCLRALGIVN